MKKLSKIPKHKGQLPITVEGMIYCPICGFGPWDEPIASCDICPCCFTEYGFDDTKDRQGKWIKEKWFENKDFLPDNWDPDLQLNNAIEGWDMWGKFYD